MTHPLNLLLSRIISSGSSTRITLYEIGDNEWKRGESAIIMTALMAVMANKNDINIIILKINKK